MWKNSRLVTFSDNRYSWFGNFLSVWARRMKLGTKVQFFNTQLLIEFQLINYNSSRASYLIKDSIFSSNFPYFSSGSSHWVQPLIQTDVFIRAHRITEYFFFFFFWGLGINFNFFKEKKIFLRYFNDLDFWITHPTLIGFFFFFKYDQNPNYRSKNHPIDEEKEQWHDHWFY